MLISACPQHGRGRLSINNRAKVRPNKILWTVTAESSFIPKNGKIDLWNHQPLPCQKKIHTITLSLLSWISWSKDNGSRDAKINISQQPFPSAFHLSTPERGSNPYRQELVLATALATVINWAYQSGHEVANRDPQSTVLVLALVSVDCMSSLAKCWLNLACH